MPEYTPARAPVTYPRGTLWLVIGILAFLFAIFVGWVLFLLQLTARAGGTPGTSTARSGSCSASGSGGT